MRKYTLLYLILLSALLPARGQSRIALSLNEYLELVRNHNLEYAAEKLNINVAEAAIESAKVFNDPQLAIGYFNNEMKHMQMGYGGEVELSKTFSPGKRKAAIDLARSESELAKALLADYFRNLQAEATFVYLEAQKQVKLFQVKQNAYENVRQLADADSVRYTLGKIRQVDAIQSRLESGILYNEVLQAETELKNSFIELALMAGSLQKDTLYVPSAALKEDHRVFFLGNSIAEALNNRADLAAALKNSEVAQKSVKVAKRERNMDFDLSVGVNRNARVLNEEAPAPAFTGLSAGIAIPLKFSNAYKGALKASRYQAEQAAILYKQAELQVQSEVTKAYQQYASIATQVRYYENGLLAQAKQVVDGKKYSYERGETSLLEILDAQRTYDSVQTLYYETLFSYSAALVELERSIGIWDIK